MCWKRAGKKILNTGKTVLFLVCIEENDLSSGIALMQYKKYGVILMLSKDAEKH